MAYRSGIGTRRVDRPGPVTMSYLLIFATGAKRTEARMQERPGYRDYEQRVAFFFPRPPTMATPAAAALRPVSR